MDGFINIEDIKFVDTSGTITATFAAAQFGSGKISTTSTITGDTGTQALIINLAPGESLDLSGLSFSGWTNGVDTIDINGSTGAETIVGTSQSDVIFSGGGGGDTMTGGGGVDAFRVSSDDAVLEFGNGNGNNGSVTGYSRITDFAPGATAAASELLRYSALALGSSSTTNDSTLLLHTGATIKSHTISNGIVTFDDGTGSQSLITAGDVAAATQYLAANDWGKDGATVAFIATISGVTDTYVYTQTTNDSGIATGAMVDLVNVSATSIVVNGTTLSVLDATGPAAPVIVSVSDDVAPVTGLVANNGRSNDTTLTVGGTAEAGSTVTVYDTDGTTVVGTGVATGGAFSITTSVLGEGVHALTARATDAAGNQGAYATAFHVTIDTSAPGAPSITAIAGDSGTAGDHVTNDQTLTLSGTAEAGDTVEVFRDGVSIGTTVAGVGGDWSLADVNLLADGTYQFTARATDGAGNQGAASAAFQVTIDTTAPVAPTFGSVTDNVAPVTGLVADNGTTNDTTLTIDGTAELGSTVTVYDTDGTTVVGTGVATGGAGPITTSALSEGAHTLTLRATDAAGNQVRPRRRSTSPSTRWRRGRR